MARLLIVEDERDIRDLIVQQLRDGGHDAVAVGSAAAAFAAVCRHGPPDAAVLDVGLPDMDGIELLGRLRDLRPGLPAVIATVLWSGEAIARIHESGGHHLAKPFNRDDLYAALRRVLPAPDGERAA
ncbi:response regulator [Actinomadura hibisca]|uniref:response regulator n=1 Tax=Actinomadura hibisca TaxID=68565 RepID=UPI000831AF6A|nr:response regulator [Actinomadura hibisca]